MKTMQTTTRALQGYAALPTADITWRPREDVLGTPVPDARLLGDLVLVDGTSVYDGAPRISPDASAHGTGVSTDRFADDTTGLPPRGAPV